ncbi:MAG: fluoride efflux transporter CrcB [Syntrophobacteraceae bacterium]|nr:fluoride efflux transporter CrcB [Syntrophobacteraceae bacterium]
MKRWIGRIGGWMCREETAGEGAPAVDRPGGPPRGDRWWLNLACVMLGGSLGALTRHGTSRLVADHLGNGLPWGTLIVNLSGCFLIGICFALGQRGSRLMAHPARLFLVTGYLGSLTTFSAYALESVSAMHAEAHLVMAINFLCNNALGVALVFLGMWVGRPSSTEPAGKASG